MTVLGNNEVGQTNYESINEAGHVYNVMGGMRGLLSLYRTGPS
jgi:hypothetical protein